MGQRGLFSEKYNFLKSKWSLSLIELIERLSQVILSTLLGQMEKSPLFLFPFYRWDIPRSMDKPAGSVYPELV